MERVLLQNDNYIITHEFEVVSLTIKKVGKEVVIGDFYGDPTSAFISNDESYCVVGGCGIIIYYLKEPFIEFEYNKVSEQWKEVFRNPNDIWWIDNITEGSSTSKFRFYVDENDDHLHAGIYEIDAFTFKFVKLE